MDNCSLYTTNNSIINIFTIYVKIAQSFLEVFFISEFNLSKINFFEFHTYSPCFEGFFKNIQESSNLFQYFIQIRNTNFIYP